MGKRVGRGLVATLLLLGVASPFQPMLKGRSTVQFPSSTVGDSRQAALVSPLFRRCRTLRPSSSTAVTGSAVVEAADDVSVGAFDARERESPENGFDREGAQLGAWIPIGSASALAGLGPQQVRVMGMNLVVWHKPTAVSSETEVAEKPLLEKILRRKRGKREVPTEWSVQSDVCPHRLAPLSQGRVDETTGCVECPYHGWQFDSNGTLVSLPQLDEGRSLESVQGMGGNVQTFPVLLSGDLIFAFLPTSVHGESFPRSLHPEEYYPYLADDTKAGKKYFVRELPYSADFLIENFMDPAHIPFAHNSLQSVRDDGTPIAMEKLVSNFTHVEVSFKDQSRGKKRDGILSFQRPSLFHFRLRKDGSGYTPSLKIFITPVEAGRCRVIFAGISAWFLPTWLAHAAGNRFLNTDTWLHDAERTARANGNSRNNAENDLDYVYGSKSDLGVSAFRQWWTNHGFKDSPPNTFGPADASSLGPRALTRREQIDPWESHSKHCSECRAALKIMKKGQIASLVCGALSGLFLRGRPIISALAIGLGIWTHFFLRKCATVIEGNPYASGVDDRSPAANN